MYVLHVKRMLCYQRGAFFGLELYARYDWSVSIQNTHGSHLSRCHFVRSFVHNLQTLGHILAFYIPNNLSAIGDVASQL